MNGRKFVQFPHPGGEHKPDSSGQLGWNSLRRQHARKFMKMEGAWLEGSRVEQGEIWAWGEWEPESSVIRSLDPITDEHPRYLWKPFWVQKSRYTGLHNTDPFIFDGFYYTDCKQGRSPSLNGLRQLGAGSVIVFGSAKNEKWVLDTLLVVRDYIDHDWKTYEERLARNIPECFWHVTLAPTYQGLDKKRQRRLYIGATHNNPVEEMYSFFPCMPAGDTFGFARPSIELPSDYFSTRLRQGARGQGLNSPSISVEKMQELWTSIVEQVLAQGLRLGVASDPPNECKMLPGSIQELSSNTI